MNKKESRLYEFDLFCLDASECILLSSDRQGSKRQIVLVVQVRPEAKLFHHCSENLLG
jgi:hypothetical protein